MLSKQLICIRHGDKAWKEEIRDKIKSFEAQSLVYKWLRTVLEQTDPIMFEEHLNEVDRRLRSSEEVKNFREYFFKLWVPKKHQWSFAYR